MGREINDKLWCMTEAQAVKEIAETAEAWHLAEVEDQAAEEALSAANIRYEKAKMSKRAFSAAHDKAHQQAYIVRNKRTCLIGPQEQEINKRKAEKEAAEKKEEAVV